MKKLLLTFLLLFGLGLAASAEELLLFDVTAQNSFSASGSASTTEKKLTIGDYTYTVLNAWWQKNTSNSYIAFKKGTPAGYVIMPKFEDKIISKISLYLPSGITTKSKFSIQVNDTKIGSDITWTTGATWAHFDVPAEYQAPGTIYKIITANTGNQCGFGKLQITYTLAGGNTPDPTPTTITLDAANLVAKAGDLILENNGEYELAANTVVNFNYETSENAEITYSYEANDVAGEGNTYTFDGKEDVMLTVKATSENEVTKTFLLTKKYPTECPTPTFNVEDGATVYAGQTISISCEGAETLMWAVNDADIDGDSYTITEEVGTNLTFYAIASVTGKDGEISNEATITVIVAEKTEATFQFNGQNGKGYGLTAISDNQKYESDQTNPVTEISEGIVKIKFEGDKYRYWNNDKTLRVQSGTSFTISVPAAYYIESIKMSGTSSSNVDSGTFNNGNWSSSSKDTSVKFSPTATTKIESIVVKYAKQPEVELVGISHNPHFNKTNVVYSYTLHVNNHIEGRDSYEAVLTVNGKEFRNTEHTLATDATAESAMLREQTFNSTHKLNGIVKATGLDGDTEYAANFAVLHNGTEIYNEPVENFKTGTVGIEDVTVDGNEAAEYFNLQGVRVAQPEAGSVYIVRRGAKATKELVK